MDEFVRYYVMHDNPIRDGEETVTESFLDQETAEAYVEKNPTYPGWRHFPEAENYVVKATTTYERIEKKS